MYVRRVSYHPSVIVSHLHLAARQRLGVPAAEVSNIVSLAIISLHTVPQRVGIAK